MFNRLLLFALVLLQVACSDDVEPQLNRDAGLADGAVRPITFPQDEAPHKEQMEWWYYTGRLANSGGGHYGFELTFFQPRIAGRFIHIVHLAVTDMVNKKYDPVMQVTADPIPKQPAKGFKLKVGDTEASGHAGQDHIKAKMEGYAFDLSLKSTKPVTLQYGTGWMKVGSDKPFYYYSYTNMAAKGWFSVAGKKEQVTGKVWMDHQWGTIGKGYGWDWFSLRLDDDSELMLFKVRRDGKDGFGGGTLTRKDGTSLPLAKGDFTVTNTGSWTSPHTKTKYSHGWKISVPPLKLDATVTPLLADQEFSHTLAGSPTYWEGLCDVKGTREGKTLTGHAYVEITGKTPQIPD